MVERSTEQAPEFRLAVLGADWPSRFLATMPGESLAFGFLVESGYWGVYRLGSRAWLVTK